MTALLRLDNVALRRGGRLLFEGLSFALEPGEALHVAGPNGTGKSSLIRLAAGLLEAERGSRVEAASLTLADDNLALDRELPLGAALRFWEAAPEEALQAFGILHLAAVPVRFLSSGQQKKATLARAFASGRSLLLLDEPQNALDADGLARLSGAIAAHLERGGAVLAASHQPMAGTWRTLELGR